MAKTPLANDPDWAPEARAQAPNNVTPIDPKRTKYAPGAVPPPVPPRPAPSVPRAAAATPYAPEATANVIPDRQPTRPVTSRADRASRVGTQIHGTQGLQAPSSEAPKLRLVAGKVVPGTRYRIIRWIGEGGMGVVYEAEHVDIERRVALKILRFDLSQQPRMVQVFRDEARAASRLGSDHIVEIYDFGELADGRLFFAMELLEGRDLVPAENEEPMDPARLIAVCRQVCKALHVAHLAGVVHRDVKPENIISTKSGGRPDMIKIVDFGISAMLAAGPGSEGGIAGTPHYMAPEQILGRPFDGRLDVYALGCTMYELATGEPPFDASTVEQLLQMQCDDPPPPVTARRPDLRIPPPLEAVIIRCLAKDPAQRFTDMADLEAALCEAQIAAGIQTIWDDLPVPELPDLERRERLLREMPSPIPLAPAKRSFLWPAVAGASTFAAAGLALFLAFGRGPTDEDKTVVDGLATEALEAASRAHWVVPPEPDAPTAYRKILELESVEGSAEALADDRGGELRGEFAQSLRRQADAMWDEGATKMARETYVWSLLFDDSDSTALERANVSPGVFADFKARAEKGAFNDLERLMGQLVAVHNEEDPAARDDLVAALSELEDPHALGYAEELGLADEVVKGRGRRASGAEPPPEAKKEPEPEPELEDPEDIVDPAVMEAIEAGKEAAAKSEGGRKGKRGSAPDPRSMFGKAERDPDKAKELADQGLAALRAGRRSEAASLFNQAIAHDRRNAVALMGLSDVYFDTGSEQKAVVYAEKAVAAAPTNAGYRLKLGDAYFKVLRYKDALEQYEQAKKLGSNRADDRIAKVKARTGG